MTASLIAGDGLRMWKRWPKVSISAIFIKCSPFRSLQESSISRIGGRESFSMIHKDKCCLGKTPTTTLRIGSRRQQKAAESENPSNGVNARWDAISKANTLHVADRV